MTIEEQVREAIERQDEVAAPLDDVLPGDPGRLVCMDDTCVEQGCTCLTDDRCDDYDSEVAAPLDDVGEPEPPYICETEGCEEAALEGCGLCAECLADAVDAEEPPDEYDNEIDCPAPGTI